MLVALVAWAALGTATPAPVRGPLADLGRGFQAFRSGEYRQATRLLAGLSSRLPRNRDYALYLLAESEFYAGSPARARAVFSELEKIKTSRFAGQAAWRVADCFWLEGRRSAAADIYRRVLRSHPSDGDPAVARFRLGEFAEEPPSAPPAKVQRPAKGRAPAKPVVPDDPRSWYRQVQVHHPSHPLSAEAAAREAALGPATATAGPTPTKEAASEPTPRERLKRASRLSEERNYAAAVDELERLPRELPPDLRVERDFELGMVKYRTRREYAAAAKLLLDVAPHMAGERAAYAAFHGARALSRSDRDDDAIDAYGKVVARYPNSRWAAEAQFLSGWLDFNRRRYKAALPALRATIARYPRTAFAADAAWFLTLSHHFLGDPEDALAALEQHGRLAVKSDADAPRRVFYWRARLMETMKRTGEARALYRQAVERFPFNFYGLLAQARLRAAGERPAIALGRWGAAGVSPARLDLATLSRAEELLRAGLDVEAGVELLRGESEIWKRQSGVPGLLALLDRYPRMRAWKRGYQLAETRGNEALGNVPDGSARLVWEAAYPRAYADLIERYAPTGGSPPLFLYSIMRKESGFAPHEVSYADARGLMQMIPPTSARVAEELGMSFFPDQLFDPEINIRLAAAYIGALYRKFGEQPLLAAGGYNGGPRAVMRWCDLHRERPVDEFVELVSYEQTREYMKRVTGIYARYRYLYGEPYELPLKVECGYRKEGPEY